jgi:transmembrane sensor
MNYETPYDIIAKYLSGQCSAEEKTKLEQWIKLDKANSEILEQMQQAMENLTPEPYKPDVEHALLNVSSQLGKQNPKLNNLRKLWMSVAAALVIGLGIFAVVKIGTSKVTMYTVETFADANLKTIVLPDNSTVVLRQNSRIVYPSTFKGEERKVEFTGEAYFVIIPDKSKPFIIQSGKTITKVLGTEFNLKSVKTDSIVRLTVTKGLVSFSLNSAETANEVKVAAGEVGEAYLSKEKVEKFANTDPNFLAWKTGKLVFENQKLGSAIKTISEYYHQPFVLATGLDTVAFSSTLDSLTLDQALENLLLTLDVEITLENGVYRIKQKS